MISMSEEWETRKQRIISQFQLHEKDTGSAEVQVALLTERIKHLSGHLQMHKKDHSSRRGLLILVGHRANLLKYLARTDRDRYEQLIQQLGLRPRRGHAPRCLDQKRHPRHRSCPVREPGHSANSSVGKSHHVASGTAGDKPVRICLSGRSMRPAHNSLGGEM